MATPDEVRASLLAVADHGRDGVARRRVAEQVREVVEHASEQVALAALAVGSPRLPHTKQAAATAASAVVLASDLRAPDAVDFVGHVPNVANWRERLAKVERLLAEFWEAGGSPEDMCGGDWAKCADALAEVRAILEEGE